MQTPGITWGDRKRRSSALVAAAALVAVGGVAAAGAGALASTGTATRYIVQARPGQLAAAMTSVTSVGGRTIDPLGAVNGFTVQLPAAAAAAAAAAPAVLAITPDAAISLQGAAYAPTNEPAAPQMLAQALGSTKFWAAGYYGQGVGVAVLDSGVSKVDGLHRNVFYGPDLSPEGQDSSLVNLDTFGHGTFMSGLIAGRTDAASRPYTNDFGSTTYLGTAPEATVISVKVADSIGNTQQSTIIRGIDWVIQHRNDAGLNIRVLNLSLGAQNTGGYLNDPLSAAAERAWAAGIVVVTSAGNDGTYTYCANQNGTCTFNGTANVAYGANGKWAFKDASGSIACNDSVFGDPNVGTSKACFFRLTSATPTGPYDNKTFCSNEGATCSVAGGANVAFGVGTSWAYRDISNGVACNTATFGDPAPGQAKACFYRTTSQTPTGPVGLLLPAADPYVIAVGAIDNNNSVVASDDRLADFSNRGASGVRTPDLSAMGTHIIGLRVPGSFIDMTFSGTGAASDRFFRGSGTSESAAITSGAAALLLSRFPSATPDQVKAMLRSNAMVLPGLSNTEAGTGALFVGNALNAAVPAAVQSYSHAADWSTSSANWSGGTWSNNVWTAAGTSQPTTTATGSRWTGSRWTGSTWTGSRWTGSTWAGSRWTEHNWS